MGQLMADGHGQIGGGTLIVEIGLAGEGEVEAGEIQRAHGPGGDKGLGHRPGKAQAVKFLYQPVIGVGRKGENVPPGHGEAAVFVPRHLIGQCGQFFGVLPGQRCQFLCRTAPGRQTALVLKAVRAVENTPHQAETGIDAQQCAQHRQQYTAGPQPPAGPCDQAPHLPHQIEQRGAKPRQDQHLRHGDGGDAAQLSQPLLQRQDHTAAQPVHGGFAAAQGEVHGEEYRQPRQPQQKGAAIPDKGFHSSSPPVKYITEWPEAISLPVSSWISDSQKAVLPPTFFVRPVAISLP